MTDEETIRGEAEIFYDQQIEGFEEDILETLDDIKQRLLDFYSSESKAIFLDELRELIADDLKTHRQKKHGGKAKEDCVYEIHAERLFFYIKQEMSILPAIAHSVLNANPQFKRTKVFVSYSHFDKVYLDEIRRFFKPFEKYIDFWDDTKIQPGQRWKEEIKRAINESKVAILLVSTDFLGSEFIYENELPPLLEAAEKDGAAILIVLLRPCAIEEFPKLTQFQAMHALNRPVAKMDVTEREELYVNLVKQTRRILEQS